MEKVKLVYGGGRALGVKTLAWLCTLDWLDISIIQVPREYDADYFDSMHALICNNNLPVYTIDDASNRSFDIGLSVNYHKILPGIILDACKRGFYNVHHTYNLRLRGRNITTHAILNSRKENVFYHGTTLHRMTRKLDNGGIVASYACTIENDDTAYTLFHRVDELAFTMIQEWFPRIALENVYVFDPPTEGVHSYKAVDLPERIVTADMDARDTWDLVRAFDFPGYAPAYTIIDNEKTELVIKRREDYANSIVVNGCNLFSNR